MVVTVEPETVHTVGDSERNDTSRGSFASVEADNKGTGRPRTVFFGGIKRIVCGLVPVCAWNERRVGRAAA
jgi:hypothetical protein